jgi:Na+-transporting NADH:ubiquinone oxidoreductase subunit B
MLTLQTALWLAGVPRAIDPLAASLGGGWMMGVLYMITCPVTSSTTNTGRWIYGALFGVLVSLIRVFSIWSGGVHFSVLFCNMFAPIIDHYIRQAKAKKRAAGAAA